MLIILQFFRGVGVQKAIASKGTSGQELRWWHHQAKSDGCRQRTGERTKLCNNRKSCKSQHDWGYEDCSGWRNQYGRWHHVLLLQSCVDKFYWCCQAWNSYWIISLGHWNICLGRLSLEIVLFSRNSNLLISISNFWLPYGTCLNIEMYRMWQ